MAARLKPDSSSTDRRRPSSSHLYFYEDLPQIASCNNCAVYVPVPNIVFGKNKDFLRRKSTENKLHSFGVCTILLLEYSSDVDVVNFSECGSQIPVITINLNRIIDKTLKHVVKKTKVWQEFHLNDGGKKRSFVIQFQIGQEFEDFYEKLQKVVSHLHTCRKKKARSSKKYFIVGFKEGANQKLFEDDFIARKAENRLSNSSWSSAYSEDSVDTSVDTSGAPFSPKPFIPYSNINNTSKETASASPVKNTNKGTSSTLPTQSRVSGLDAALTTSRITQSKTLGKYHSKILGGLEGPPSLQTVLRNIDADETLKHTSPYVASNTHDSNQEKDFLCSLNITDVDNETGSVIQSQDIRLIDKDCTIRTLDIREIDFFTKSVPVDIREIDKDCTIRTLNITEIDLVTESVDIREIDKDRTLTSHDLCFFDEHSTCSDRTIKIKEDNDSNTLELNGSTSEEILVLVKNSESPDMKARQEQNQLKQYAHLLQAAINDGDQENARQYADILAASNVKVSVTVDEINVKVDPNSQDMKIKVFIEDKECQGGSLILNVKSTDTIGDLKAKMFFKHKFPVAVQKWIVGKRIPKDDETLKKLRLHDGNTVYLYLVSAKSVGLDKQTHMASTGGYTEMTITDKGLPQIRPAPPVPQQMNQLSAPPKQPVKVEKALQGAVADPQERVVAKPMKPEQLIQPEQARVVEGSPSGSKQVGWQCKQCTFLNVPTRPGCEMCSYPRPKDYKIPENYEMSKEEIDRIKKEEEDERKAQQAAAERRAREKEPAENIYNKMTEQEIHQLLTLNDQMQQQILQTRQTGGQEHEFNEGVQIPRGTVQPQGNLENIQFTFQPDQHLDFSQENDESLE